MHKNPINIRPTINWKNASAYPLAAQLTKIIYQYVQLPNAYNVTNTEYFISELADIDIDSNTRPCLFDITNMYTNIPTDSIIHIITMIMNNNYIDTNTIHEIILINTILEQNYFQFDNKYYKLKEGLAMGAPTSGILSEICLQYIEHTHVSKILQNHNIIGYYRYVDDVLIIYNINKAIPYIIYMILITLTRS
jgi:hypothetical protein